MHVYQCLQGCPMVLLLIKSALLWETINWSPEGSDVFFCLQHLLWL